MCLLISNPAFSAATVSASVTTTQVAPTTLQALGLAPSQLQAVKAEGTQALPSLPF